jgi:hypothetical protein
VLDGQSGDRQARAEALMLLLLAAGEQPYRLVHGTERKEWHCAVLKLDDGLAADAELAKRAVRIGRSRWLLLIPAAGLQPGDIPAELRDPAGTWTASIAVDPFTPPEEKKSKP